jgi:hypothetical protein
VRKERQPAEDACAALRAATKVNAGECAEEVAAIGGLGQQLGGERGQELAAESEFGVAMAVGQEAVVANALKTGRHGVLEETADELLGGEGHHLGLVAIAIILPFEGDLAVFQSQEAPVGDGHAVGIAAEILQHVLRSAKRRLSVDHPLLVPEGRQVAGKGGWVAQFCEVAEELEFTGSVGLFQRLEEQSAEEGAEDLHGQEEFTATGNPAFVIGRQTAGGNHAMEVGMKASALTIP